MSVACTVDDVSPDRKIRLRREYNSDSLSKLISRVMHLGPEDMKLFYDLCENPPPLSLSLIHI